MFLAREIGAELVQGGDLLVHNGFVYMRMTGGLQRADVIYRRIDDDFLDPLAFRADSQLGTPGLFYAFRLGNVAIANTPGTRAADDKSIYAYVPDMIRYFLSEEPLLANVETHLCRDPEDLEFTLDNLERLVVKTVGGSGGYGMLVGPRATLAELSAYAEEIRKSPANFVSQPTLDLSCAPCLTTDGAAGRHVDLRPFVRTAAGPRSVLPGRPHTRLPRRQFESRRWRQRSLGTVCVTTCFRGAPRDFIGSAVTWSGHSTAAACWPISSSPSRTSQSKRSTRAGGAFTLD